MTHTIKTYEISTKIVKFNIPQFFPRQGEKVPSPKSSTQSPSHPTAAPATGAAKLKSSPIKMSPSKVPSGGMKTMREMRQSQEEEENRKASAGDPRLPPPSATTTGRSPMGADGPLPMSHKSRGTTTGRSPMSPMGADGALPMSPESRVTMPDALPTRPQLENYIRPEGPGHSLGGNAVRGVRQSTPDQDELRRKRLEFLEKQQKK